MKTTYRYTRNLWAINSGLLFFIVLFLAIAFVFGFGHYAKGWLTAIWFFIPIPFLILQFIFNLVGKLVVNDNNLLIWLTTHHKAVSILQVSSITKVYNKKGKIKRLILHVHPERNFRIAPYEPEVFIKQVTRLNPRIQVNEHIKQ